MKIKLIILLMLLAILLGCHQTDKRANNVNSPTTNFIQPPIKNADVAFKEYTIDAEKGDTIFYQTGSIILFPPNSFVDKNGNLIKGDVKVKYREFSSPIDFFLAGIPMGYDSSGNHYTFESSGMCEILAYKDTSPVFVNPTRKPEINIATQNNSAGHSIYYLDTTQKKWVWKGPSIVTDPNRKINSPTLSSTPVSQIVEPLKPEKANAKDPIIKIVIDPASFKELLVYDNLQFQLDPNEKNFNPKDASVEWSDVELIKGNNNGLYKIKFSNANKTVYYSARPVLEGKDYDKALKIFDKKNKEYQKELNARLEEEKANKINYIRDSINYEKFLEEDKRMERLNALIEIRNKKIEKQNAAIEKRNRQIVEADLSKSVMRGFEIDGFGIWNCDKAISLKSLPIVATFNDNKGNPIELTNVAVIYKSFNGILKFEDNHIQVIKDADNMIIGVYNGKFAYITYEDYNILNINSDTKEQTFKMTIVEEKNNNYNFIKTLIGQQ